MQNLCFCHRFVIGCDFLHVITKIIEVLNLYVQEVVYMKIFPLSCKLQTQMEHTACVLHCFTCNCLLRLPLVVVCLQKSPE